MCLCVCVCVCVCVHMSVDSMAEKMVNLMYYSQCIINAADVPTNAVWKQLLIVVS